MIHQLRIVALTVAFGFMQSTGLLSAQPEPGNIIYDSLTTPPAGGSGLSFGYEIGSAIELHGADRSITRIDLRLSDSSPEKFRVKFYNVDAKPNFNISLYRVWATSNCNRKYRRPSDCGAGRDGMGSDNG